MKTLMFAQNWIFQLTSGSQRDDAFAYSSNIDNIWAEIKHKMIASPNLSSIEPTKRE